jgi:cytidine deaminase
VEGDSNRAEQARIIEQIITEAKKEDEKFNGELLREVLTRSGIRDLTEFGRVVHAEMEALLSCARNSISTQGATMFCTTFPCHNCAKHIVAAGLKRVIYVEPYPKSKALTLHNDSIVAQNDSTAEDHKKRVVFQPFVGVGPRRFFDLFSMNLGSSYKTIRKIRGNSRPKNWSIENAQLRLQMKPASYLELEAIALNAFRDIKACAAQPLAGDSQ